VILDPHDFFLKQRESSGGRRWNFLKARWRSNCIDQLKPYIINEIDFDWTQELKVGIISSKRSESSFRLERDDNFRHDDDDDDEDMVDYEDVLTTFCFQGDSI